MQTLEIFGNESANIVRARKGAHMSANRKHGNTYLSSDAKELLFGKNVQAGRLLIVHSGIENNWYLSKNNDPKSGFECRLNDMKLQASMRVNGAQEVIEKMAQSFNHKGERIVFEVSDNPIQYQGMNLYKLTLINY